MGSEETRKTPEAPDAAVSPAERVTRHLARCRDVYDAGGPAGFAGMKSVFGDVAGYDPDPGNVQARAELFELLGYDALTVGRPGWAYVCLRAASEQLDLLGAVPELRRVRQAARQVLESSFPPYTSDRECLEDIRRWARARIGEVAALGAADHAGDPGVRPASVINATTALKHTWTFRLLRTREVGQRMRFDGLADTLGLSSEDRVLLRILVALYWDPAFDHARLGAGYDGGPLTVGQVVDLVSEDPRSRPGWVDRLDPRHPLLRWALVHLGGMGAMRRRTLEPDDSVLAWMEGRDAWPHVLRDVAAVRKPIDRPTPDYLAGPIGRLDRLRQRGADTGLRVHGILPCTSTGAARGVVDLWAGKLGVPVIELSTLDLEPRQVRALAREAVLRDAVIFVPRDAGPDLADLDAAAGVRLLVDAPPGRLQPSRARLQHAVAIEVRPPKRAVRPALWNEALIARGLAEVSLETLDVHLGPYPMHPQEMARVVAQAADRATIDHEGGGPVRVTVDALRELIASDPDLVARVQTQA